MQAHDVSSLGTGVFLGYFGLILVHEWGHYKACRLSNVRVIEFAVGLGPIVWGYKKGETDFNLRLIPFGGYVRMHDSEGVLPAPSGTFQAANLWQRSMIILAGVFMNYVTSIVLISGLLVAGTQPFLLDDADIENAIETGQIEIFEDESIKVHDVQMPVYEAVPEALAIAGRVSVVVLQKFFEIPLSFIQNGAMPEGLTGPIGIAKLTHDLTPQGISAILRLAAMLSLSLGVINLVPIPALDGGRMVYIIFEAVTGKPPTVLVENILNYVSFGLLLLLMVVVTIQDILNLI